MPKPPLINFENRLWYLDDKGLHRDDGPAKEWCGSYDGGKAVCVKTYWRFGCYISAWKLLEEFGWYA